MKWDKQRCRQYGIHRPGTDDPYNRAEQQKKKEKTSEDQRTPFRSTKARLPSINSTTTDSTEILSKQKSTMRNIFLTWTCVFVENDFIN